MAKMKIKREAPGAYTVSCGEYVVRIVRNEQLDYEYGQWIAYAEWDRYTVTDPVIYLADAKRHAKGMIEDRINEELERITASNRRRMEALGIA